jgi:hypothetical protein
LTIPGLVKKYELGFVEGDQGVNMVPARDGTGKLWWCEGDYEGNGPGWVLTFRYDGGVSSAFLVGLESGDVALARREADRWLEENG